MARTSLILAALAVVAGISAYGLGVGSPRAGETRDLNEIINTVHQKFPDVKYIDTAAVKQLLSQGGPGAVQVVDVREPDEFKISHLPGAINVPPETSDEDVLAKIKSDRPVLVYCSVGWRSSEMAERLQAAGRINVVNYAGSIFEWANADQALESSTGTTKVVHPYDRSWGLYLKPERRAF